jgi:hypothetical protein
MYKCNSLNKPHQRASGDWRDFFAEEGTGVWGRTAWVPDLQVLQPGDRVLAYQTNRNELVGVAEVDELRPVDDGLELWLTPTERLGAKVRPLKRADALIAKIPALAPGPVKTIYDVTPTDAVRLLRAARRAALDKGGRFNNERQFLEGERRATLTAARNAALRAAAKRYWGAECYCCGFSFGAYYGPIARGVAIVHHLHPFYGAAISRASSVQDVRVVCANCHQVLHLKIPPLDPEDLRTLLARRHAGLRS